MSRSAARKGSMSWVAINRAIAAMAVARSATQTIEVRLRFHASAWAASTNPASTAAAAEGVRTLKRSVSSQSMGARIKAEVPA